MLTKKITPLRIALTYILFSVVWIYLADIMLDYYIPLFAIDHVLTHTITGWLFALVSVGLIYFMLRKDIKLLQRSEERFRGLVEN